MIPNSDQPFIGNSEKAKPRVFSASEKISIDNKPLAIYPNEVLSDKIEPIYSESFMIGMRCGKSDWLKRWYKGMVLKKAYHQELTNVMEKR